MSKLSGIWRTTAILYRSFVVSPEEVGTVLSKESVDCMARTTPGERRERHLLKIERIDHVVNGKTFVLVSETILQEETA